MSKQASTSGQPGTDGTTNDPSLDKQGFGPHVSQGSSSNQRAVRACTWIARIGFAIVFIVNVQCALSFVFEPSAFVGAYELSGVPGNVAIQGMGVVFLMWNVPYAVYIAHPVRFHAMGWVAIVQQTIGLVGESLILAGIPAGHTLLSESILRFIAFDALGLVIMMAVQGALAFALHKTA